ncbi:MAG TPA: hypothetical protein VG012_01085 [Acidimicrobiia bacterium]|nr:hypothetical protein [Acidimicrobiia bacterium]
MEQTMTATARRPLPVAWIAWLAVLALLIGSGAFLPSCAPPGGRAAPTRAVASQRHVSAALRLPADPIPLTH